jgi:transposase
MAGTSSVAALETLIHRGQNVLPPALQQRSHDLQETEDDFFRFWGEYGGYLLYFKNPPLKEIRD